MEIDQRSHFGHSLDCPVAITALADVSQFKQGSVPGGHVKRHRSQVDYLDLESPDLRRHLDTTRTTTCSCVDCGLILALTSEELQQRPASTYRCDSYLAANHLPWNQLHQGDFKPTAGLGDSLLTPAVGASSEVCMTQQGFAACMPTDLELTRSHSLQLIQPGLPESCGSGDDSRADDKDLSPPVPAGMLDGAEKCSDESFLALMVSELEGPCVRLASIKEDEEEEESGEEIDKTEANQVPNERKFQSEAGTLDDTRRIKTADLTRNIEGDDAKDLCSLHRWDQQDRVECEDQMREEMIQDTNREAGSGRNRVTEQASQDAMMKANTLQSEVDPIAVSDQHGATSHLEQKDASVWFDGNNYMVQTIEESHHDESSFVHPNKKEDNSFLFEGEKTNFPDKAEHSTHQNIQTDLQKSSCTEEQSDVQPNLNSRQDMANDEKIQSNSAFQNSGYEESFKPCPIYIESKMNEKWKTLADYVGSSVDGEPFVSHRLPEVDQWAPQGQGRSPPPAYPSPMPKSHRRFETADQMSATSTCAISPFRLGEEEENSIFVPFDTKEITKREDYNQANQVIERDEHRGDNCAGTKTGACETSATATVNENNSKECNSGHVMDMLTPGLCNGDVSTEVILNKGIRKILPRKPVLRRKTVRLTAGSPEKSSMHALTIEAGVKGRDVTKAAQAGDAAGGDTEGRADGYQRKDGGGRQMFAERFCGVAECVSQVEQLSPTGHDNHECRTGWITQNTICLESLQTDECEIEAIRQLNRKTRVFNLLTSPKTQLQRRQSPLCAGDQVIKPTDSRRHGEIDTVPPGEDAGPPQPLGLAQDRFLYSPESVCLEAGDRLGADSDVESLMCPAVSVNNSTISLSLSRMNSPRYCPQEDTLSPPPCLRKRGAGVAKDSRAAEDPSHSRLQHSRCADNPVDTPQQNSLGRHGGHNQEMLSPDTSAETSPACCGIPSNKGKRKRTMRISYRKSKRSNKRLKTVYVNIRYPTPTCAASGRILDSNLNRRHDKNGTVQNAVPNKIWFGHRNARDTNYNKTHFGRTERASIAEANASRVRASLERVVAEAKRRSNFSARTLRSLELQRQTQKKLEQRKSLKLELQSYHDKDVRPRESPWHNLFLEMDHHLHQVLPAELIAKRQQKSEGRQPARSVMEEREKGDFMQTKNGQASASNSFPNSGSQTPMVNEGQRRRASTLKTQQIISTAANINAAILASIPRPVPTGEWDVDTLSMSQVCDSSNIDEIYLKKREMEERQKKRGRKSKRQSLKAQITEEGTIGLAEMADKKARLQAQHAPLKTKKKGKTKTGGGHPSESTESLRKEKNMRIKQKKEEIRRSHTETVTASEASNTEYSSFSKPNSTSLSNGSQEALFKFGHPEQPDSVAPDGKVENGERSKTPEVSSKAVLGDDLQTDLAQHFGGGSSEKEEKGTSAVVGKRENVVENQAEKGTKIARKVDDATEGKSAENTAVPSTEPVSAHSDEKGDRKTKKNEQAEILCNVCRIEERGVSHGPCHGPKGDNQAITCPQCGGRRGTGKSPVRNVSCSGRRFPPFNAYPYKEQTGAVDILGADRVGEHKTRATEAPPASVSPKGDEVSSEGNKGRRYSEESASSHVKRIRMATQERWKQTEADFCRRTFESGLPVYTANADKDKKDKVDMATPKLAQTDGKQKTLADENHVVEDASTEKIFAREQVIEETSSGKSKNDIKQGQVLEEASTEKIVAKQGQAVEGALAGKHAAEQGHVVEEASTGKNVTKQGQEESSGIHKGPLNSVEGMQHEEKPTVAEAVSEVQSKTAAGEVVKTVTSTEQRETARIATITEKRKKVEDMVKECECDGIRYSVVTKLYNYVSQTFSDVKCTLSSGGGVNADTKDKKALHGGGKDEEASRSESKASSMHPTKSDEGALKTTTLGTPTPQTESESQKWCVPGPGRPYRSAAPSKYVSDSWPWLAARYDYSMAAGSPRWRRYGLSGAHSFWSSVQRKRIYGSSLAPWSARTRVASSSYLPSKCGNTGREKGHGGLSPDAQTGHKSGETPFKLQSADVMTEGKAGVPLPSQRVKQRTPKQRHKDRSPYFASYYANVLGGETFNLSCKSKKEHRANDPCSCLISSNSSPLNGPERNGKYFLFSKLDSKEPGGKPRSKTTALRSVQRGDEDDRAAPPCEKGKVEVTKCRNSPPNKLVCCCECKKGRTIQHSVKDPSTKITKEGWSDPCHPATLNYSNANVGEVPQTRCFRSDESDSGLSSCQRHDFSTRRGWPDQRGWGSGGDVLSDSRPYSFGVYGRYLTPGGLHFGDVANHGGYLQSGNLSRRRLQHETYGFDMAGPRRYYQPVSDAEGGEPSCADSLSCNPPQTYPKDYQPPFSYKRLALTDVTPRPNAFSKTPVGLHDFKYHRSFCNIKRKL